MVSSPTLPWPAITDDLGPAKVVLIRDPGAQLEAIVVVDNVACGPAIGGVRIARDVSLEEVARLARAMTFKNAAAGLPHGGGKAGIARGASRPSRRRRPGARCSRVRPARKAARLTMRLASLTPSPPRP
jgi:hypothetical protein